MVRYTNIVASQLPERRLIETSTVCANSYPVGPLRDPGRPFLITGPLKSASHGLIEGPFWAIKVPRCMT